MPIYLKMPFSFHSRSVFNWVRQSSRLWTCISSILSVRKRLSERRIWAMPSSRPRVQTLVAMKACLRAPIASINVPAAASERPYIGELSIIRPPASNRIPSTLVSRARSSALRLTSKVR